MCFLQMHKILIFGNSGSGKTTMAHSLSKQFVLAHFDLDTVAWLPTSPPTRRPLEQSQKEIEQFVSQNDRWVIEGCYSDLLSFLLPMCTEIRFLNPGVDVCVEHCRARPWEPHKYDSKKAQDANLDFLIGWVKQYHTRDDEFSLTAHQSLFNNFSGTKSHFPKGS